MSNERSTSQIPARIRALIGMVACHAAGAPNVKLQIAPGGIFATVSQRDGNPRVWSLSLTGDNVAESLEELDAAILRGPR